MPTPYRDNSKIEEDGRSRAALSPSANREESVLYKERIVGYILVLLNRAHSQRFFNILAVQDPRLTMRGSLGRLEIL